MSKLLTDYAGVVIAENKLTQIKAAIKGLSETPHIGSLRSEIAEGLRAIPSAGKGVITFTVDDSTKTVYLVSITYAGADWMSDISLRT